MTGYKEATRALLPAGKDQDSGADSLVATPEVFPLLSLSEAGPVLQRQGKQLGMDTADNPGPLTWCPHAVSLMLVRPATATTKKPCRLNIFAPTAFVDTQFSCKPSAKLDSAPSTTFWAAGQIPPCLACASVRRALS